jgi:hypothetical protein
MTALQTAWTIVFAVAVVLFLAVEIVVVVGGARDLKDMVRSLLQTASQQDDPEPSDR